MTRYFVRRDTAAWSMQTWISFGAALFACLVGIWNLPVRNTDHVSLAIAVFFCLFASFALAKTVRDNRDERVDTNEWIMIVWAGFIGSILLTGYNLVRLEAEFWVRGYMLVSWLFLVSSVFTLAKLVRDKHEADLVEAESAKEA